jgi:hypothetical protein
MRGPQPVGEEVGHAREARRGVAPTTTPRRGLGKTVRSVVLLLAIGLAAACEARLDGAACPCVEPQYTCDEAEDICRRTIDSGPGDPDASTGVPDGSSDIPDGGFVPDAAFFPDSSVY